MIKVIIGMQWGSEGKGSVAQILATKDQPELAIRVGGPNAGHSIAIPGGTYPLRHVPAAVVHKRTKLALGPESLVLPNVLAQELRDLRKMGWLAGRPLHISPRAAVITKEDIEEDNKDVEARGSESTRKGIGVTRAKKARRLAKLVGDEDDNTIRQLVEEELVVIEDPDLDWHIQEEDDIHIESTQGFLLSLNYGDYPHVTSRDLTVTQALNDAGFGNLPTDKWDIYTVGVARTFPIRIAGRSGPLPGEVSWEELAAATNGYIQPELTTVTRKVRRIARWNDDLFVRAVKTLTPNLVFLTFMDYLEPGAGRAAVALKEAMDADWQNFGRNIHEWNHELVLRGRHLTAAFVPLLQRHAHRLTSGGYKARNFKLGATIGQAIGDGPDSLVF